MLLQDETEKKVQNIKRYIVINYISSSIRFILSNSRNQVVLILDPNFVLLLSLVSKPSTLTPTDQFVTCSRLVARSSKAELTSVLDRALEAELHIGSS